MADQIISVSISPTTIYKGAPFTLTFTRTSAWLGPDSNNYGTDLTYILRVKNKTTGGQTYLANFTSLDQSTASSHIAIPSQYFNATSPYLSFPQTISLLLRQGDIAPGEYELMTENYYSYLRTPGANVASYINTPLTFTVIGGTDPNPPTVSVPDPLRGGKNNTISWFGASSTTPGTSIWKYVVRRWVNWGTTENIYEGKNTSYTDFIDSSWSTVGYYVWAYDTYGNIGSSGLITRSVVTNAVPTTPSSITVPATINGGQTSAISWGSSTDSDGNLSGYKLERQVNGGTWTEIYVGNTLSYTDTITAGWNTVAYRVRAYDTVGDHSGYQTSATRTVINNIAPTISGGNANLGTLTTGFPTQSYTVTDAESGSVSIEEALDGVILRTYSLSLSADVASPTQTLSISAAIWQTILNGAHTATITATDSGGLAATRTFTFTKQVTVVDLQPLAALPADAMPTRCVVNVQGLFPSGCVLQVWVCNNGNDISPSWEDIGDKALTGKKHFFSNIIKTAAAWGVKVRVRLDRGTASSTCALISIGGTFD